MTTDTTPTLAERLRALDDETMCFDAAATYAAIREAADALDAKDAEIARLRERLEIDPEHPFDGIAARDETIRQLEIDRDAVAGERDQERARADAAERERDDLLTSLGFKAGPLDRNGEMSRKVILDDAAGLRPAMVKARREAKSAQADAALWHMIVHERSQPLLLRVWQQRREAERRAWKAEFESRTERRASKEMADQLGAVMAQCDRMAEALRRVRAIADDYHPDSDKDAPLALSEMREALQAALAPLPAETAGGEPSHIWAPYNPCLAKLEPDEPFFVLLGRDEQAAPAVRFWADIREEQRGVSSKTTGARQIADQMDAFREARRTSGQPGDGEVSRG